MLWGVSRLAHMELRTGPGVRECSLRVFLFDTYPGFPWPCWNRSWWKRPLALMTNGRREPFLWDEESSLKSFRIYKVAPSFWEQALGCFPVSECLKRQQLNWSLDYKFCFFRFLFIRVGYLLIFCLILGIAKIFWTFKTLRASVFKTLENPPDSFLGCPGVAVFGSLSSSQAPPETAAGHLDSPPPGDHGCVC